MATQRKAVTAWEIGEQAAAAKSKPLGKFGSATVQRIQIPHVTVEPAKLNPALWADESENAA